VVHVLASDDWKAAKSFVSFLAAPREFDKLVQYSKAEMTDRAHALVRACITVNTSPFVSIAVWERDVAGALKLATKEVAASELHPAAAAGRATLVKELKSRLFALDAIVDRDLVAMMLNPLINVEVVTGSKSVAAKARRLYEAHFEEALAFIGVSPRSMQSQERSAKRSKVSGDLLGMAMAGGCDDNNDVAAGGEDGTPRATEMTALDALRLQAGHPDIQAAIIDGAFSPLLFYSQQRHKLRAHKIMAQRIYADQATEAVSERSFSTAGMYASPLRKKLGAKIASMMVKCNKNHDWLFDKIKDKIKDHYFRKFRNTAGAFDEANPDFEDE